MKRHPEGTSKEMIRFIAGVILIFCFIFLVSMEIWFPEIPWSMIALVAFTMVYVTLIYISISDTSILRKEDRILDFKRRKLDWIVNWAREVRKSFERAEDRLFPGASNGDAYNELQSFALENDEIIMTAEIFGVEFQRIVEKAAKDLWAATKPGLKYSDRYSYKKVCIQSFSNVLKSALKVEDELVKTSHK